MSGPAQWSNHLRLTARLYEPLWRKHSLALLTLGGYSTERELEALVQRLAASPGTRVLDLGCSAGLYARRLARAGADVTAVDVSKAFLAEGERLAAGEGVSVSFVRADVHDLPFEDAAFDSAASGGSLNEFADPARALREAARVLRSGGRLWLMYAARGGGAVGRLLQLPLRLSGLRFPKSEEVDAWARAAGFEYVRSERRGPVIMAVYRR